MFKVDTLNSDDGTMYIDTPLGTFALTQLEDTLICHIYSLSIADGSVAHCVATQEELLNASNSM